jgi:tetratricopeptide (TPR) repeat protein
MIWSDAYHLKQLGQFDQSIEKFQSLLALNPDYPKASYELGTVLAATGRRSEAVLKLHAAVENDPNDPSPWALLGWLDYLAGETETAYGHYCHADEIEPWNAKIKQMLGQCLSRMGRWGEAAKAFEFSLEIDPNQSESIHALRIILKEQFSPADALAHSIRAVDLAAGNQAESLLLLAEVYFDLGQNSEAMASLVKASQIDDKPGSTISRQIKLLKDKIDRSSIMNGTITRSKD